MSEFIDKIVFGLLCIPGPLLPLLISHVTLRKRFDASHRLFVSSVISLAVFTLCIGIPFYFQGYSQIQDSGGGEPLGWTKLPFVGTFAYIYTWQGWGFCWLILGLLEATFGDTSKRRVTNYLMKGLVCSGFAVLLFEFHKFKVINVVLE